MSRALVTGAAGFIGRSLSERLGSEGAEVVGLDARVRQLVRERLDSAPQEPEGRHQGAERENDPLEHRMLSEHEPRFVSAHAPALAADQNCSFECLHVSWTWTTPMVYSGEVSELL